MNNISEPTNDINAQTNFIVFEDDERSNDERGDDEEGDSGDVQRQLRYY